MRKAAAIGTEYAGGMGLIHQQHRVMLDGDLGEIGDRGRIAVHAVEAFDSDPRRAGAATLPPIDDHVGK